MIERRKKPVVDLRFQPHGTPKICVWESEPPSEVIDDLRQHTRQDGRPDLWEWHLHTKPPKGSPTPRVVADGIDVPEKLRGKVGRAPCPLCSLNAGRYFKGVLTWWPQERALRVIGHECGERFFGAEFTEERARYRRDRQLGADFDYLATRFSFVEEIITLLDRMSGPARILDQIRARLLKGISLKVAKQIYNHVEAYGGLAKLEDERIIPKNVTRCQGWRTLGQIRENASSHLFQAGVDLRPLDLRDDDAFLDAATNWGPEDFRLARLSMINAARHIKTAHRQCTDLMAFLTQENLDELLGWSYFFRAGNGLDMRKDEFGAFIFTHHPHRVRVIARAPELRQSLPDISILDMLDMN